MQVSFRVNVRLAASLLAASMAGVVPSARAQNPSAIQFFQSFTSPTSGTQQAITSVGLTGVSATSSTFHIYAFNGSYVTGSSLWQATLANIQYSDALQFFPNIVLASNALYVFGLAMSQDGAVIIPSDSYAGGQFLFNTGPTSSYAPLGLNDLQGFNVQFQSVAPVTPTPEPASLALLGTGLVGVVGVVRSRRRQAAAV